MEHADVSKAFDMVLARIQEAIDDLNSEVIDASRKEEFDVVQRLATRGQHVIQFREQVLDLQHEWNTQLSSPEPIAGPPQSQSVLTDMQQSASFADSSADEEDNLPSKQKEDFYVPILNALVELGGRAKADEVLDRLEEEMEFNARDLHPRPAGIPVRWMHTAHRARHDLVHEKGFLSASSPRGIWEITDAGRNYLTRTVDAVASVDGKAPLP
jgi:hypothetical protein